MPLSKEDVLSIVGSLVVIFFLVGIILLILGYRSIPTDETGACSCVNLSNELIGIFWGLATASFILLVAGIFLVSLKIPSSAVFKLMALSILGAIIVFALSQRVGKCNIGCNHKVDTAPPLLITGWVLIVLSLIGVFYILTQVDVYKQFNTENISSVGSTKNDICDQIFKNAYLAKGMSDEQILGFIKQYNPKGISDEQILSLIQQYRPLLS